MMKRIAKLLWILMVPMILMAGCTSDEPKENSQESQVVVEEESSQDPQDSEEEENSEEEESSEAEETSQESQSPEEGEASLEVNPQESEELTDEDILKKVEPYLENLVYQDPENYSSQNDFWMANLGLDDTNIASGTLYMGAPNQNTGYFLMLTKAEGADTEKIREKLESQAEAMVKTAEMGYTQGYTEYSIIESGNRFFLVMQEDAEQYSQLVELLSGM